VLLLLGVKSLAIFGAKSPKERSRIMAEFRNGGRDDARVLLISSVGSVGLNIPEANILIFLVRIEYRFCF
jgi:superfamily II DNA or RNA helicase